MASNKEIVKKSTFYVKKSELNETNEKNQNKRWETAAVICLVNGKCSLD